MSNELLDGFKQIDRQFQGIVDAVLSVAVDDPISAGPIAVRAATQGTSVGAFQSLVEVVNRFADVASLQVLGGILQVLAHGVLVASRRDLFR